VAEASFDSLIKWFKGRIGGLVFRRSHNGKVSVYPEPDMSRVKWSQAQKDHRQRMSEAFKYASAAIADPEIRQVYVQKAVEWGMNPKRPFDAAVRDYTHGGEDLLWKKHMGDQEKPQNWKTRYYPWYFPNPSKPKRRKQRRRW
jgi:hypothetical protein